MPRCIQCQSNFTIQPPDQNFLQKNQLPEPNKCYNCWLQHISSFISMRYLYRRKCQKCGEMVLTVHSSSTSYATMYCKTCWFSDTWPARNASLGSTCEAGVDALMYGMDFDFSRLFFPQFFELLKKVPHFNMWYVGDNENCDYCSGCGYSKNCYLSFELYQGDGCAYCHDLNVCKDCVDLSHCNYDELIYDCVRTNKSYKSASLTRCQNCTECYLGRDISDCQNCFGCVNMKHKQYYWYNEPLTKEVYEQKLTEALRNRTTWEQVTEKFYAFSKQLPVRFAQNANSENVIGEYNENSSNIRTGFYMLESENCGDVRGMWKVKDSYRSTFGAWNEISYQTTGAVRTHNVMFCNVVEDSHNVMYSAMCYHCHDIFGCVGLKKKEYCIFNKQYTKEEYFKLKEKIVAKMRVEKEFGEFFPVSMSPFGYNTTLSQEYSPLTKEEAKKLGWKWEEDIPGSYGKETVKPKDMPLTIQEVTDDILKEILVCGNCKRNYKIVSKELDILRALKLPLPLFCPECRYKKRFERYYRPRLYQRPCACELSHNTHSGKRCEQTFETTYAPEREEKVFCKDCYQKEILD